MKKLIVVVVLLVLFSSIVVNGVGVNVSVRPGATLWGIAQDFDMSVSELMKMNDLEKTTIHPGQKLEVNPYPDDTAIVSWYGAKFDGKLMANNKERFDMNNPKLAAHKWLPFGTRVRLTRKNKSITVIIKDRGPYVKGRNFDISKAAAKKLGIISEGVARCKVKIL